MLRNDNGEISCLAIRESSYEAYDHWALAEERPAGQTYSGRTSPRPKLTWAQLQRVNESTSRTQTLLEACCR